MAIDLTVPAEAIGSRIQLGLGGWLRRHVSTCQPQARVRASKAAPIFVWTDYLFLPYLDYPSVPAVSRRLHSIMKSLLILQSLATLALAQYASTYTPENAPDQTQQGQAGTNKCGTGSSQTSKCQNAYINSVDDFCLFAPPEPGPDAAIGVTERIEVAWCLKNGTGSRLIPDGTLAGVHFVKTPDYVQITGTGDLTKLNIPAGDAGGELDPHGADGNGNPIGGLVFSTAFGEMMQLHEWTNFMSAQEFCFRGCKDGPNAEALCQHIYDEMGCAWNMPGNYDAGVFEQCAGDTGDPMGVYGGSTFRQGDANTPPPHPAPASSQCSKIATLTNGVGASSTTSATSATSTMSRAATAAASPTSASATPNAGTGHYGITSSPSGHLTLALLVTALGFCFGGAVLL